MDSGAGMLLVQRATLNNSLCDSTMSYQVLARKWRPQHFHDMIGQDHVVKALCNALDNSRLHHAYLFTGMRGVGKTTIARVFAKSLNCETNGVSSKPCGECNTCLDIEAGRFFDLIEVDAASRTGVDDTRELLENVPYAPSSGRFKVYLIDEVHMFSKSSFNALLKTLEEPPEHVKFILATTDPQKVPVTVLSRCLQFNLKAMPESLLVEYLGRLLDSENIKWETAALAHIARASEGSVRDSLSLVEQAAAFGNGQVTAADVESMLGRLSPERLLDLLEAIGSLDAAATLAQVEMLAEYSPDYAQILAELLSTLHQVALVQSVGSRTSDTDLTAGRIDKLATSLAPEDVQLFYQIGLHGRRDLPYAPDPRGALEMTLLRMLAFRPAEQAQGTSANPAGNESASAHAAAGSSAPPTQPATTDGQPVDTANAGTSGAAAAASTAAPPPVSPHNTDQAARSAAADSPPAAPVAVEKPQIAPISLDWTPANWSAIVAQLGLAGMPMQLASNCSLVSLESDKLQLALGSEHDHLNSPRALARLEETVSSARGRKTTVSVELASDELDTPVRQQVKKEEDALASAQDSIRQDPLVQSLVEKVDGTVVESSVKPLDT